MIGNVAKNPYPKTFLSFNQSSVDQGSTVNDKAIPLFAFPPKSFYIRFAIMPQHLKILTDSELAGLLRSGDAGAYTEIFLRFNRVLVAHAYRMLGDRDRAMDVVQDVLLKVWQNRESLQLSGTLSGYLYRAVRNRILDEISHQEVVERYVDSAMAFVEQGRCPSDDLVIEKELFALVEKEIALLPENMRRAFILRKQQELGYEEVAAQLGISEAAAKQQVYNAVKLLRLKLADLLTVMLF
ncbi:RNA polymerase sigma factor [Mucilaginibacter corticis]|nr:sigma-70 family RNA polymerase sigma factor [Mucilaginibacter corticis]